MKTTALGEDIEDPFEALRYGPPIGRHLTSTPPGIITCIMSNYRSNISAC